MNIAADDEVVRETDAEIRTPRGFLRMEVGLISRGNTEVISDKVGRMDRNSVILIDLIPARSTAYETAKQRGVKLIPLRNNHPIEELRIHLSSLNVPVNDWDMATKEVETKVLAMPDSSFSE